LPMLTLEGSPHLRNHANPCFPGQAFVRSERHKNSNLRHRKRASGKQSSNCPTFQRVYGVGRWDKGVLWSAGSVSTLIQTGYRPPFRPRLAQKELFSCEGARVRRNHLYALGQVSICCRGT
jgi:hypothetical protein